MVPVVTPERQRALEYADRLHDHNRCRSRRFDFEALVWVPTTAPCDCPVATIRRALEAPEPAEVDAVATELLAAADEGAYDIYGIWSDRARAWAGRLRTAAKGGS